MFDKYIEFDISKKGIIGLNNELKCLYLMQFFKKTKQSILLVTNTLYEANYLYQCLLNYGDVLFFPMDDFLTSEALAISPELKITRLETMNSLNFGSKIVVTNLMGYLRHLPLKEVYEGKKINIKKGNAYDLNTFINLLYDLGYVKEDIVNKTGEYASRGYVVDIFSIGNSDPIRIEFWGDEVDSLRYFDVDTQRTIEELDEVVIYPNTEFLTTKEIDFEERKQRNLHLYDDVTNIMGYLDNGVLFFDNYSQIDTSYKLLLEEMNNYRISNNIVNDFKFMMDLTSYNEKFTYYFMTFDDLINQIDTVSYSVFDIEPFIGNNKYINERLNGYLKKDRYVVICLDDRYKVNKVIEELNNSNIVFTNENNLVMGKINLIIKVINESFIINNMVVISSKEFFNKKNIYARYKSNFKIGTKIRDINKINVGDYIVHSINGIGKYLGLKSLLKNGLKKDYLMLEYRDGDKLYVPVEKMDYITKYSSSDGFVPKLSKLGGTEWIKTKIRAREHAKDIANDLLKLYAEREKANGFAFKEDDELQLQFEKEFAYEPTSDQLKVIGDIKHDMESSMPMDRLVCGDVGYGKTEIAFRAMFKAILSGKQVAMLCPTTILSQQHYQNALERFRSFPVKIALLNRFVSYKTLHSNLNDIKDGKVDIVIGTHRLLGEDVTFKDLGLLIVDEEQRFGVTHKEKIKKFRNNVDVITLSATPIPRTLQMSMSGIRSLSLIETPPSNRYPIQTYVLEESNGIVKDAIYKELSRNGQVYILYNHVPDMESKLNEISKLIPQARIACVHGQMDKREIEDIMMKFVNYEYDVLICTTIIETGIDIANANTLIIIDADKFGLSQLYQIRGRVGRTNKIAYCYLMYNKHKVLSEIAVKRLKVIREFTELGSGFAIAMRDLSIRGAGNILGSEQSGFVDSIGVEMFTRMLNEEILRLNGEDVKEESNDATLPLVDVETSISDEYTASEDLKIELHKKINEIDSIEKLEDMKTELEDRFGMITNEMVIYMYNELLEKQLKQLKIEKIHQTKNFIEIILPSEVSSNIDGEKLFIGLYEVSRMFRLSYVSGNVKIILDTVKLDKHFVYYLLDMIHVIERSLKTDIV